MDFFGVLSVYFWGGVWYDILNSKSRKGYDDMKKLLSLILALCLTSAALCMPADAAVSDVKPGHWSYAAVQYNVDMGLIAVDYDKYDKGAPAPRQDVAYAMYKLTNGKDNEPTRAPETQYIPQDMQNSPDKYKYSVQWAVGKEIIAGTKTQGDHASESYKT